MKRRRRFAFAPRLDKLEPRLALSGVDPTDPVDIPNNQDTGDPSDGALHVIAPTPPADPNAPVIA